MAPVVVVSDYKEVPECVIHSGFFMVCIRPFLLKDFGFRVPCGKCVNCKIQRTREWAMRCVHEASLYDNNVFVTLTISDEHMLYPATIKKRSLQLFIKRFRKMLGGRKIRYYACGEYGDESGRPHYHLIMFNVGYDDFKQITIGRKVFYTTDAWQYGNVYVDDVNYCTCRYVAKYVHKKYYGPLAVKIYNNRHLVNPFQLQSLGIGKGFAVSNAVQLRKKLYVKFNGKKCKIPRYYCGVIGIDASVYEHLVLESQLRYADKYGYINDAYSLREINQYAPLYQNMIRNNKQLAANYSSMSSIRRRKGGSDKVV